MTDRGIGPLVLAGSGEYTPTMDLVDRHLLDRCDGKPVILIATACALEGADVMTRWEQMGVAHFQRLGVNATPVRIADQDDAGRADLAAQIAAAGLVWFSGGSAAYLARTFEGTPAWQALLAANTAGGAVAGASGGLGVLNPHLTNPGAGAPQPPTGLGMAAPVRAISHFDRIAARRPDVVDRALDALAPGQALAGVEEDTAVVWTDGAWRAMGHKRVHVFGRDREPLVFGDGDRIDALPPPARSLPDAE